VTAARAGFLQRPHTGKLGDKPLGRTVTLYAHPLDYIRQQLWKQWRLAKNRASGESKLVYILCKPTLIIDYLLGVTTRQPMQEASLATYIIGVKFCSLIAAELRGSFSSTVYRFFAACQALIFPRLPLCCAAPTKLCTRTALPIRSKPPASLVHPPIAPCCNTRIAAWWPQHVPRRGDCGSHGPSHGP
jgi:hypothetical protein